MDPVLAQGETDGSWSVDLPAEEVPPELPEPCLGINFARDGMQKRDWLALVAVHSDSWLCAVAFYYGAKLDPPSRWASLFLPQLHRPRSRCNFLGDQGGLCPDASFPLGRLRLFRSINQHPTLYEIVTGKHRAGGKDGNKRKRVEMVRLSHGCPEGMPDSQWSHERIQSHCDILLTLCLLVDHVNCRIQAWRLPRLQMLPCPQEDS